MCGWDGIGLDATLLTGEISPPEGTLHSPLHQGIARESLGARYSAFKELLTCVEKADSPVRATCRREELRPTRETFMVVVVGKSGESPASET